MQLTQMAENMYICLLLVLMAQLRMILLKHKNFVLQLLFTKFV